MREPAQPLGAGRDSNRRCEVQGGGVMDVEFSRIPVCGALYRGRVETQVPFSSKKQCAGKAAGLELNKDPDFNLGSNVAADDVFRATNQGIPKSAKKAEPSLKKAATRGPPSRYKLEAELKAKNQLLESAKQQLHSRLTGAQGTIKELKEENEGLVQEVEKLKKFQETCMVILESRNIDPVTGSNILEEEEKTQECQKQTMLLTEKLMAELRLFNQTAGKEKEALQAALAKWKLAEEARRRSLEKHGSFRDELKECWAVLDQLEQLLAQ
ncbi:LOW QUALITY PROTEIN: small kinetochore-associated protein [Excalfactoria chinensis]|uniref:LOW QUALITY PROTEIN: small kinetochore-associated protein n=1 Tax=Excalfactoria chinensis TaxID=46218 RepID=UPI003B3BA564